MGSPTEVRITIEVVERNQHGFLVVQHKRGFLADPARPDEAGKMVTNTLLHLREDLD